MKSKGYFKNSDKIKGRPFGLTKVRNLHEKASFIMERLLKKVLFNNFHDAGSAWSGAIYFANVLGRRIIGPWMLPYVWG